MYAGEVVFVFQIVMFVHGDAPMVFLWQKGQQPFAIHGCGTGFVEVQIVETLVEQGGEDFIFFHEKGGFCHDSKFHSLHFMVALSAVLPKSSANIVNFS